MTLRAETAPEWTKRLAADWPDFRRGGRGLGSGWDRLGRRRRRLGRLRGSLGRRGNRRRNNGFCPALRRGRSLRSGGDVVFPSGGERAIDLGFDQNVVGPADHDQMLDVVAPDQHKLSLPVEAERVDETQARLSRTPSRHAQPVSEHEPVEDRQDHQGGDSAGREKSDLDDAVVGKGEIT